jgi:hypothetical protein
MLILKRVTLLMKKASGDSAEKNGLLIHMTVIILTGLADPSKQFFRVLKILIIDDAHSSERRMHPFMQSLKH